MSSGKHYRPLTLMADLADRVRHRLSAACLRIEVAGSIRRQEPMVGDIEMVAIPRLEPGGLFGERQVSKLDTLLKLMQADGRIHITAGGTRQKKIVILTTLPTIQLDLFLVAPESWGYQLAIRTGPADYSKWLVTRQRLGGGLDDAFYCRDGAVWEEIGEDAGIIHPVPEERDFFALIRGGWVSPPERGKAASTLDGGPAPGPIQS